jgi:hypothetical protein
MTGLHSGKVDLAEENSLVYLQAMGMDRSFARTGHKVPPQTYCSDILPPNPDLSW